MNLCHIRHGWLKLLCLSTIFASYLFVSAAPQNGEATVQFRELESYRKDGNRGDLWRNVIVSPKTTREQLIALAKQLHASAPDTRFRIFTDDKEFAAFMRWDMNYPNSTYPYPKKWAKKNYVAMINRMASASGGEWQLVAMDAGGKFVSDPYSETITKLN